MTIRNISAMMIAAAQGTDPQQIRNDAGAQVRNPQDTKLVDRGTVIAVLDGGLLNLQKGTGEVILASQVTDEPLTAGQAVYWSATKDGGTIVHGSAK